MHDRDIAEKQLFDYDDVFADIVNVLLFHGRSVIHAGQLETARDRDAYPSAAGLREMERDVSKLGRGDGIVVSLIGIENQSRADRTMVLRVMGYDALAYRKQVLDGKSSDFYPVFTLVLSFSLKPWPYPRDLEGVLRIPEEYQGCVSNYTVKNLFEVAFLPREVIDAFTSDFYFVADCVWQLRAKGTYTYPPDREVRHLFALMRVLAALTGDQRFVKVMGKVSLDEGGKTTMAKALDTIWNGGKAEGLAEGKAEGLAEGKAKGHAEGKAEGLAEGKAKGLAEGKAEGLAEGKAKGLAEGLAEGKAKQKDAFARKLLDAHFSDADIISYAEISAQRLQELKEQMVSEGKEPYNGQ